MRLSTSSVEEFGSSSARPSPAPVPLPIFPIDSMHSWRNWGLVPPDRIAAVSNNQIERHAIAINGPAATSNYFRPTAPSTSQSSNGTGSCCRTNSCSCSSVDRDQLAFTLREDDFLFVKLGNLKPNALLSDLSRRCDRTGTAPQNPGSSKGNWRLARTPDRSLLSSKS